MGLDKLAECPNFTEVESRKSTYDCNAYLIGLSSAGCISDIKNIKFE